MQKRKKIIILWTIIIAVIALITLPIIPNKCKKENDELYDYQMNCSKKNKGYWSLGPGDEPMLPIDCREYNNEYKPVIWLNLKKYKNSCYACRDCQKWFFWKSILNLLIQKSN